MVSEAYRIRMNEHRTFHEILVEEDLIWTASRLDMAVASGTFEVINLIKGLVTG